MIKVRLFEPYLTPGTEVIIECVSARELEDCINVVDDMLDAFNLRAKNNQEPISEELSAEDFDGSRKLCNNPNCSSCNDYLDQLVSSLPSEEEIDTLAERVESTVASIRTEELAALKGEFTRTCQRNGVNPVSSQVFLELVEFLFVEVKMSSAEILSACNLTSSDSSPLPPPHLSLKLKFGVTGYISLYFVGHEICCWHKRETRVVSEYFVFHRVESGLKQLITSNLRKLFIA